MDINKTLYDIATTLELGVPTVPAERVMGGYMHKMYRLETNKGKYAVKLLNPIIMTRPDVFKNYKVAEDLEEKLQNNNIPIIPALTFGGRKMQSVNNQYFYVFDWCDGKALHSQEIEKEHCEIIGGILARIHKIEQTNKAAVMNEINIDWDFYIDFIDGECSEIVKILENNRKLLFECQNAGNAALKNIPKITVISNGDMDSKNVLWVGKKPNPGNESVCCSESPQQRFGTPQIIDLECLSYGNPYMEMFQLALCWSGYEHCNINYELLITFIKSYIKEYGSFESKWEDLYNSNFGRLEWLEYNVKRALMLECENEEEKRLGTEQVYETMKHIIYYAAVKDELLGELDKMSFTVE